MDAVVERIDRAFLLAVALSTPNKADQEEIIWETAKVLPPLLERFEITSPLRIAHFIAQLAHESDGFHTTEEYASGAAYEGRSDLGNTRKGDGVRFKGRGLIQVTGRTNHHNFTLWIRSVVPDAPDFEAEPTLLEEFPWAVWSAVWFWTVKRLNVLADRDDLVGVTRIINGGKNGLADRAAKLARAKTALARIVAGDVSAAESGFPILHRGMNGDQVECLQRLLAHAGYYRLAIDGDFGAGTETALRAYQIRAGLKVDGLAGNMTFSALLTLLNLKRGAEPWTLA